MLDIKDLHASVDDKEILNGLSLQVKAGEVHAIMGPNGSGKSTLANVIAGREGYDVTSGTLDYRGKDLLEMAVDERACEGIARQPEAKGAIQGAMIVSAALIEGATFFALVICMMAL